MLLGGLNYAIQHEIEPKEKEPEERNPRLKTIKLGLSIDKMSACAVTLQ